MITITFDHADLDYKLQRLASAARVDLGKVIRQEGGNVAMSIMMILPPTGQHENRNTKEPVRSGLTKAARNQGEFAIKSDLFGGRTRKIKKQITTLGIFQRIGSSKLKYRDRYGRIGYVDRNPIGRWQVQDQMWISDASADRYLNSVQSKVGWAKAGFAAAAIACGQRVPAWIRRHAQRAGIASVNFGSNPFVIGTSVATKIPDIGRYIQAGLNFRVKITQMKVDRILANQAVNLGFGRIDGAGRVQENMPR